VLRRGISPLAAVAAAQGPEHRRSSVQHSDRHGFERFLLHRSHIHGQDYVVAHGDDYVLRQPREYLSSRFRTSSSANAFCSSRTSTIAGNMMSGWIISVGAFIRTSVGQRRVPPNLRWRHTCAGKKEGEACSNFPQEVMDNGNFTAHHVVACARIIDNLCKFLSYAATAPTIVDSSPPICRRAFQNLPRCL
jgi:hypothetical protein